MKRRPFGWTGVPVPVVGQGTWNLERDERARVVVALRAGLDQGMTHIDTAEMYGSGVVEELIGEAIAGRRDEVFLASKVLPSNASFERVLRACEASLRRLRTDRLDLYLLHWPGTHPLERTIAAFERLVRDGKIRFYGVSNFDAEEMAQALAIAGERRIACNQVLYHLRERSIEHAAYGHGSSRRRESQAEPAAELGEECVHLGALRARALACGRVVDGERRRWRGAVGTHTIEEALEVRERVDGEAEARSDGSDE